MNLYSVLLAHGYGVVILNSDAYGNLVFYVTTPGYPNEADLLLVDAQYGHVLERKHIAAYTYDYDQNAAYAPYYAPVYAGNDNCERCRLLPQRLGLPASFSSLASPSRATDGT
jgi:hypothetical protein